MRPEAIGGAQRMEKAFRAAVDGRGRGRGRGQDRAAVWVSDCLFELGKGERRGIPPWMNLVVNRAQFSSTESKVYLIGFRNLLPNHRRQLPKN